MTALRRFLDEDSVAKVVVVCLLSAAALVAVPKGTAPGLPTNAGSAFSAPGPALVMMGIGTSVPSGAR